MALSQRTKFCLFLKIISLKREGGKKFEALAPISL
jgi:hypothetical protein